MQSSIAQWIVQSKRLVVVLSRLRSCPHEGVLRECCLCIKVLSVDPAAARCIGDFGGMPVLVNLLETSTPTVKKIAAVCINTLSKHESTRALLAALSATRTTPPDNETH